MGVLGCLRSGPGRLLQLLLLPLVLIIFSPVSIAQQQQPVDDSMEVMDIFNQEALEKHDPNEIKDEVKHKILFFMGIALLVFLCATAYLGISMVVFNQEVFVKHMICAGITVTLGLAHAVVAIVWFFPF